MTVVAVVPLKALSKAKSRLSQCLPSGERAELTLALLDRTILALRHSGVIDRIALATPEKGLAARVGVESVDDENDLNGALAAGARWAATARAARLLIVPADLPLLEPADVLNLIEMPHTDPGIVIARTGDGGTGALLLTPPSVIAPSFGPASFDRHLAAAEQNGTPVLTPRIEAFRFDLDTVGDLEALRSRLPDRFRRTGVIPGG